jgi:molybdopterin adenylyltransferase
MDNIKVISVNTSEKKGTIKTSVPFINLTLNGVEGAHSGPWNRQVSLLGTESIIKFEKEAGRKISCGEFAENITTEGLELWKCNPLDRFESEDVILEVTQIGKECHGTSCAIFKEVGNCVMPKEGIFARVIRPGKLYPSSVIRHPSSEFTYIPKVFTAHIITLSDRAHAGLYEDLSGPRVKSLLTDFFAVRSPQSAVNSSPLTAHRSLIPDDPDQLRGLIGICRQEKTDIVITTGGTGIGPKDFTPDVIRPMLDKEIPGLMDLIRLKYGTEKPNALISRSIAGVMGKTLVFALPGSVKAVNEYMEDILKSLWHMIYMLHAIDKH